MDNKKTAIIIKQLLQERGETISKMTETTNINKNFMYSLNQGSKPSIEHIEKIADYFGVSIDEILGRKEYKTNIVANENTINNGNNVYYVEQPREIDTNSKELLTIYNKINKKRKLKLMEKAYELEEEEEHMLQNK